MKKWTRWQDYVVVAAGAYTALSVLWTSQTGMSTAMMVTLGVLLVISGAINLALPGMPVVEWAQALVAVVLLLALAGQLHLGYRSSLDGMDRRGSRPGCHSLCHQAKHRGIPAPPRCSGTLNPTTHPALRTPLRRIFPVQRRSGRNNEEQRRCQPQVPGGYRYSDGIQVPPRPPRHPRAGGLWSLPRVQTPPGTQPQAVPGKSVVDRRSPPDPCPP